MATEQAIIDALQKLAEQQSRIIELLGELTATPPRAKVVEDGWWRTPQRLRYRHFTPIKSACWQVASELAKELDTRELREDQMAAVLFSVIRASVCDKKRHIARDSRANPLLPLILFRAGFPLLTQWCVECTEDHYRAAVNLVRQSWAKARRTKLRRHSADISSQTGGAGVTDWIQYCQVLDLPSLTVSKCVDMILEFQEDPPALPASRKRQERSSDEEDDMFSKSPRHE